MNEQVLFNEYKFPIALALAEKFLWEMFLTHKWDHIFRNENPEHFVINFPLLPRELSFCPTERDSLEIGQISRDGSKAEIVKMISYREPAIKAEVFVFMRKEQVGDSVLWCPDKVTFYKVPILNKKLVDKSGYQSISVTDLIVWEK